jgi:hypothetical protein
LRSDDAALGKHRRFPDLLGVAEEVTHVVAFVVLDLLLRAYPGPLAHGLKGANGGHL